MVHRHSCKRKSSKYFKVVNFNACFLWPHLSPSLHPISERLTSKERLSQNCFQSVLSLIKHHLQWWYEEKHWAPTLQHVLIILSVQQFLSFYSSKYRCCFSNKICFKSSITTFQKKNKTKQTIKKKKVIQELILWYSRRVFYCSVLLGKSLGHELFPLAA